MKICASAAAEGSVRLFAAQPNLLRSEVNCWQEQIHKFKTEYLLIWQKYLSTWTSIKYFGHQVQVSTKYFWISKGQVQVSTKYSIIHIKYQVQVLYLTPTLVPLPLKVAPIQPSMTAAFHLQLRRNSDCQMWEL